MQVTDAGLSLDESTNKRDGAALSIAPQKHAVGPRTVDTPTMPCPPPLQVQGVDKDLAQECAMPSTTTEATRHRASRPCAINDWKSWINYGDEGATRAHLQDKGDAASCAPCEHRPLDTASEAAVDTSVDASESPPELPPVPENPYGWRTIEELEHIESRKTARRRERLLEDRIGLLSAAALYSQLRSPRDGVRRQQAVRALRCLTRREQIMKRDDEGLMCRTAGCTGKVVRPGFDAMTVATAERLSTWYEISNASVHRCTHCWHSELS